MTKIETAKQLLEIALNENRRPYERLESYLAADNLRKELKVGWEKLGTTKTRMMNLTTELDLLAMQEEKDNAEVEAEFDDVVPTFEESHPGEVLPTEDEFEMTADELADQALRPKRDETDPSMPMGPEGNSLSDPLDDEPLQTREQMLAGLAAQAEHQSDFVPPTVVSEPPKDEQPSEAAEAPQPLTAAERGAIGVMSRDLLQTDAPYEEIALAVRAAYPHARTTARSLASVAADMRRDGIPCPPRRKGGK